MSVQEAEDNFIYKSYILTTQILAQIRNWI